MSGRVHPSALHLFGAVCISHVLSGAAELCATLLQTLRETRLAFELVSQLFLIGHFVGMEPCSKSEPVVPLERRSIYFRALFVRPVEDLLLHLRGAGDLLTEHPQGKHAKDE